MDKKILIVRVVATATYVKTETLIAELMRTKIEAWALAYGFSWGKDLGLSQESVPESGTRLLRLVSELRKEIPSADFGLYRISLDSWCMIEDESGIVQVFEAYFA